MAEKLQRLENYEEKPSFSRAWTHSYPCTRTVRNAKQLYNCLLRRFPIIVVMQPEKQRLLLDRAIALNNKQRFT
jgi:hypothetical protein